MLIPKSCLSLECSLSPRPGLAELSDVVWPGRGGKEPSPVCRHDVMETNICLEIR